MLPILIIAGYLIGSLSSAILVCKSFGLPDPRTEGSNNPGATNVLRIGGKKAAAITLIGDGLKGVIPILIARYLGADLLTMTLIALATFLGHVYPVFFGFKGGKGVATFLGGLFALNYLIGLSFALTWLFVAKVLKISSLSALIATLLTPVIFYFSSAKDLESTYVVTLICVWIFYTHRSNITRMLSGDEGKIKP
ncbi:Acyl-phosphate:glycerol-3-phosphate O-acyltransferase PlsY (EC 2.3.1.n3) [uncultured Gammaproteobacteria bacterium]|jgi:glycerol-3-phosphate acyltransferase PlsY|uniref:Glycerol-3-phosphate acyltransferase n=3 Tax=sulfur-oxidizing symbionts TaxID=32036 RepID=A0A1H6LAN3_9GAMM|nr:MULTISPECIES: glycerol-3-phosphate 1-O-acyltransferase PlsY [sulfur-oxidizing symbionts]CAC5837796.1 Acyl-phosphate:glycerol-3-phosphate O-acyltransferase PlsY (EC 2.3.1.n3) [uncultured Gammaproteobacteria bacterium]CAB5497021.1 Acyl-phosphate:glycerol-3-phosphate O-acyltransferase PlsY (EC [Bathymodiolus azoricus thioautotrophic gill symbiont]CAB5503301.1 Acyl-phosphate:glycerol-3-phosphate O-acyltransferase PlsY (EC [Bathymodiolus thermophilus thioautotrophic gill symbiont]CAC9492883.1 Acy